jgi:hypothetical protein
MVYLHQFRIDNLDQNNINEDVLLNRIQTSMTDSDIKRYFKDIETLKYSDLKNYNNIDELLPNDKDFKIILIEQDNNIGHWVCVMKNGNTIEYFNPYGNRVDNDKKWIGKIKNAMLGQSEDILSSMMEQSPYKCIYSKKRFQKLKPEIQTCGRWCILRIICMKDLNMDIKEFQKFIKSQCNISGMPKDALVSYYIG